ncbi:hypothetical protein PGB90_008166 [Kerria lacca]
MSEVPARRAAKFEIRAIIRFYTFKGRSATCIHQKLVSVYGDSVFSVEKVRKWVRLFREGRENVLDEPRSGRPSDTINEDSISAVRAIIENDARISINVIVRVLREEHGIEIARGTVHSILHDELLVSKRCARWVLKQLTEQHRTNRMGASLAFLTQYHERGEEYLSRIVTGDESWVHYYQPESKEQSKIWKKKGSEPTRKFKTLPSEGKVLLTIFWDAKGILLEEYCPPRSTVNAASYCQTLKNLRRAIQNKRRGMLTKGVVLLHDNARPHVANVTQTLLKSFKWSVFEHPLYSPDLAPSDYWLFPSLKRALGGIKFKTDAEVKEFVHAFFVNSAATYYSLGIQKLVSRYLKCLDMYGDYVEK